MGHTQNMLNRENVCFAGNFPTRLEMGVYLLDEPPGVSEREHDGKLPITQNFEEIQQHQVQVT